MGSQVQRMSGNHWLLPACGFILATGVFGVTAKLALRHVSWTELVIWTTMVYGVISAVLLATGKAGIHGGRGGLYSLTTGVCASSGLLFAFLALDRAKASTAVPFMSAYPIVTVLLSILVLSERITLAQGAGIGLVLLGVILLSR
jgi:transporter family protein